MEKPERSSRVALNIEVGTGDLVAIRVAQVERKLTEERTALEKQLRDLEKVQKETGKERDTMVDNWVALQLPAIKTATTALEELGLDGPKVSTDVKMDKEKIIVEVTCGDNYNSKKSKRTLEMNDGIRGLCQKKKELAEEIENVKTDLANTLRQLGQIASVERQARAAIATNALQSMEGGLALIEAAQNGDIGVATGQTMLENKKNG